MKTNSFAKNLPYLLIGFVLFSSQAGAHVYKWVDDKGVMSFSDKVPDRYKQGSEKFKVKNHTAAPINNTIQKSSANHISQVELYKGSSYSNSKNKNQVITTGSKKRKKMSYEEKMRQYNRNGSCWGAARNKNGSINNARLGNCKSMKMPEFD